MARSTRNVGAMRAERASYHNTAVRGRTSQRARKANRRTYFGTRNEQLPYAPPEDWYEPNQTASSDYRIVVQRPGKGYRHVLTPWQVQDRLAQLPKSFIQPLEVVQFSRMTRKKQSFPCYGMQWGTTLYLYPIEEDLVEDFDNPPRPSLYNEAKMYGGQWIDRGRGAWQLRWTPEAIVDFYLNNILIHELGHLLDERNSNYNARERYAEWFAVEYGYRRTGGAASRRPQQRIRKRHHAT